MTLPVSARRLRNRSLRAPDRTVDRVSLFPFFDRWGEIHQVMLLTPESGEVYLLAGVGDRLRVPLWGTIRLAEPFWQLRPLARDPLPVLDGLWHFDPWWMLGDPLYAGHRAADALKETNCVRHFRQPVEWVSYRRDLSRIQWIARRTSGGITMKGWNTDLLPIRPSARPRAVKPSRTSQRKTIWQLDPIWTR